MKIASSTVAMSSARVYTSYAEMKSDTMITRADQAASLQFSKEGESLLKQMDDQKKELKEQKKKQQEQQAVQTLIQHTKKEPTAVEKNNGVGDPESRVKSTYELKLEILRKMLAALKQMQKGLLPGNMGREIEKLERDYQKMSHKAEVSASFSAGVSVGIAGSTRVEAAPNQGGNQGGNPGRTGWVKTTVTSAFVTEMEHTAYQAAGVARTEDGREISFGVTVEMSRAFCQRYESLVQEDYICTDPLMINLDSNVASVTDQKFLFDLDTDGEKEEISFAGQGSGFLALDKNKDGEINDGSELFGTKSGNGFADLAKYDKDGNGWIDENDEVFDDLKVWTKDENGEDRLIDLKEADVGAIYLGYADTEFSLNELETNQKNGIIRSTRVYLKESGGSGTVQHVDLVL